MNQLIERNRHESIVCPSCDLVPVFDDNNLQITFLNGDEQSPFVTIIHKTCSAINPKKLHICLKCGTKNKQGMSQLVQRYCNCAKNNNVPAASPLDPPSNPNPPDDPAASSLADELNFESSANDDGDLAFDDDLAFGTSADTNDNVEDDTEQIENENKQIDMGIFFSNEKEWPKSSAKYFLREYNQPGDGLRGLVYKSLINYSRETDFSPLTDEELHYHLHVYSVHDDFGKMKSKEVCKLTDIAVQKFHQHETSNLNAIKKAFKDATDNLLRETGGLGEEELKSMIAKIENSVEGKMSEHYRVVDSAQKIGHPTNHAAIRRKYLEGVYSIKENLPKPDVGIAHNCATVPAVEIVNHFLALGNDVAYRRAGYEEDWRCKDGEYDCAFTEEVHDAVKKANVPKGTRICTARGWSDAFEAFPIAGSNDHNSLQLYTLSLLNPKGRVTKPNTWPYALCFKKDNSHDIFLRFLEEVHELQKPTHRYWGRDNKPVITMVYLQMLSQDHPERCYCTNMANLGLFTHRWGHSCRYDDERTPSCPTCEAKRICRVLKRNDNKIEDCTKCQDWFDKSREHMYGREVEYPIGINEAIDKTQSQKTLDENCLSPNQPSVELSFKLWTQSIKHLEEWVKSNTRVPKQSIPKVCTTYIRWLGIAPDIAKALGADIAGGVQAIESDHYPMILKHHKDSGLELKHFPYMYMHGMALGIEKSLISKTKSMVDRKKGDQNTYWKSITKSMRFTQKEIDKNSVEWCKTSSFSGKDDDNIGTAGWQSKHYVSFTRASLYHFGPIDGVLKAPDTKNEVVKQFTRVRVVWFCLVSHILGKDSVPSSRIDHYVKLFLSSCRRFWQSVEDNITGDEVDAEEDGDHEKVTGSKKRKNEKNKTETPKKKRKGSGPFFVTGANYLSMLNTAGTIAYSGDIGGSWEGIHESYIQLPKRELDTFRHTVEFLATTLKKVLCKSVFRNINEGNPHSCDENYARTFDLRIYAGIELIDNPQKIVEANHAVAGMIDEDGVYYICIGSGTEGISMHPIVFDDNKGSWCFNLWYSKISFGTETKMVKDRHELMNLCQDFFFSTSSGGKGQECRDNHMQKLEGKS